MNRSSGYPRKGIVGRFLAVALVIGAGFANATIIAPGSSGPPDALDASGPILADTGVLSFTGVNGRFSGTARSLVVQDSLNPFAAGDLTFLFQLSSDATSLDSIQRITDALFGGFLTDVGQGPPHPPFFDCDPDCVSAATVDRSADGNVIGWNYGVGAGLEPGDYTLALIVQTNATQFTTGHIQVINADIATVDSFAPTLVPEPSSIVLLSSLLPLAWHYRRRSHSGHRTV